MENVVTVQKHLTTNVVVILDETMYLGNWIKYTNTICIQIVLYLVIIEQCPRTVFTFNIINPSIE